MTWFSIFVIPIGLWGLIGMICELSKRSKVVDCETKKPPNCLLSPKSPHKKKKAPVKRKKKAAS